MPPENLAPSAVMPARLYKPVRLTVLVEPEELTVIVALAVVPLKPAVLELVDSCTMKLPVASDPVVGVNFSPAAPCATVMKLPLAIGVVPLFWYSVPPVTAVIWK